MKSFIHNYQFWSQTENLNQLLEAEWMVSAKKRVGFILPKIVVDELGKLAGERKKSWFVARAIAKALDEQKSFQTAAKLALAYRGFSKESAEMAEEWHTLDLEDWDEN